MPTMTISVVAGAQTTTRNKTISGPHLTRWIAAKRIELNLTDPGVADADVVLAWADRIFAQERESVLTREKQSASDTATGAVAPIDLT